MDMRALPRRMPRAWVTRVGLTCWSAIGTLVLVAAAMLVIGWLRSIVVPLSLAAFLAVVFAPAVTWLQRRHIPRSAGSLAVYFLILLVLAGATAIVVGGVTQHTDELRASLDVAQGELRDLAAPWKLDSLTTVVEGGREDIRAGLAGGIGGILPSVVGSAASLASGLVLGSVLLYYLLKDGQRMTSDLVDRFQGDRRARVRDLLIAVAQSIRAYFRGRTILALAQGVAIWLALVPLDVPLPLAIGIVNVIGAYVPYLGAFAGGAFAVLMGLAGGGTPSAAGALAVVLAVNLVLENFLEPKVMGSSLKMHPIVVLLATLAGGLAAGMVGLILALPTLSIITLVSRELSGSSFFDDDSLERTGAGPTPEQLDEGTGEALA